MEDWYSTARASESKPGEALAEARRLGLEMASGGRVAVYHGTRHYEQIKATGFRDGTYFGTTWDEAAHHGYKPWEKGSFRVMKVSVDPADLVLRSYPLTARRQIPAVEIEPPTSPRRDAPFLNNSVKSSLVPDGKVEWVHIDRVKPIHGRPTRPGRPYRKGDPYEAMILNSKDELQDGYHRYYDLKGKRYRGYVPVVRHDG